MNAKKYLTTVLGAATENTLKPVQVGAALVTKDAVVDVKHRLVPALLGAAAGYYLAKNRKLPGLKGHPVLGALVGFAVGDLAYPLAKQPSQRPAALVALGATAAATYAALKWKRHPVLGYVGASVAAGVLAEPIVKHMR